MKDQFSKEEHMAVFVVIGFAVFLAILVIVEHTRKEQVAPPNSNQAPSMFSQDFWDTMTPAQQQATVVQVTNSQKKEAPILTTSFQLDNGAVIANGHIGVM